MALIISVSVVTVFISAIVITNIFIPIKYLSAYLIFSEDKPEEGELRISFIDVGYGDCTLIEFPDGKTALLDGGNGSYNNQLKILKKLNSFGIDRIDYLFCTSSADKRCGGLAEIVKYKDVGKIFAPIYKDYGVTDGYRRFIEATDKKDIPVNECVYGLGEYNEEYGYCFGILSPECIAPDSGYDVIHSTSAWISYGGISVLLLGDLTSSKLSELYDRYMEDGFNIDGHNVYLEECNVVKAANGGNKSGDNTLLYDLIKPEAAIISTNAEPSPALLADIGVYAGSNIYRTDKNGTVTLSIIGGSYKIKKER